MFKKKPESNVIDMRSFRQRHGEYVLSMVRASKDRAEGLVNQIRDMEIELRDTLDVVAAYEAALDAFNEPLEEMQRALEAGMESDQ